MTNLQIDYFLHVASTKSISRSAEELYVSPPAISKQITLMEQELDMKLFARGARGMELTPEGQILFDHWISRQASYEMALQRARSISSHHNQTLHLSFMSGWAIQKQIRQLKTLLLQQKSPVDLVTHSLFAPADAQKLESGELDAALCIGDDLFNAARSADLHIVHLTKIKKNFLFSSESPLAQKQDLSPADFKDLPLLTFASTIRSTAQYENLRQCNAFGLSPKVIIKDTPDDVFFGASLGEGFMVGDEWLDITQLPCCSSLSLEDTHTIYLVWSSHNQNPALQALQNCIGKVNWMP